MSKQHQQAVEEFCERMQIPKIHYNEINDYQSAHDKGSGPDPLVGKKLVNYVEKQRRNRPSSRC
jgi:tRNA(Ile)-lysidine synthase TilS/MesJ